MYHNPDKPGETFKTKKEALNVKAPEPVAAPTVSVPAEAPEPAKKAKIVTPKPKVAKVVKKAPQED